VIHSTFATPDLTTFCRLDELGLVAVGQLIEPDRATIECRPVETDLWCRKCGGEGVPRDTVVRRLAHEPFGHRPTTLLVRVHRYRCAHCRRTWRQDMTRAAAPRAKISRLGVEWALRGLVTDHLTVTRVAAGLGVSWSAANTAVLAEGERRARNKTGPARLLDMVEGRSKAVFKQWLANRPKAWSKKIEVVAMDGFTGFKTAAAEELPDAVPVMDPFHVVRLAGDALDQSPLFLARARPSIRISRLITLDQWRTSVSSRRCEQVATPSGLSRARIPKRMRAGMVGVLLGVLLGLPTRSDRTLKPALGESRQSRVDFRIFTLSAISTIFEPRT